MHLAVIAVIRNEADIFRAFAQHLAGLFDTALFLDHLSTDGTSGLIDEACAQKPGWTRWNVAVSGMHQSLFSSFALRHLFSTTDADAVFLLDADEFIDVPDRQSLIAALQVWEDIRCVPCLAWIHAVPTPIPDAPLRIGDGLLVSPAPSQFTKVIVTRALFDATGGALRPLAGSHVIDPGDGIALSTAQMVRKTMIAALSHLARTDRAAHEGAHRFDALSRIKAGTLGAEDLIGWASAYGEPGAAAFPKTFDMLLHEGFRPRPLDVPHATLQFPAPETMGESPLQAIAAALLDWRPRSSAGLDLQLDGATLRARRAEPEPAISGQADAQLAAARAELDLARHEINLLRESMSWRITGPLRALRRFGAMSRGKRALRDPAYPPAVPITRPEPPAAF
jgi:hypothetical protein